MFNYKCLGSNRGGDRSPLSQTYFEDRAKVVYKWLHIQEFTVQLVLLCGQTVSKFDAESKGSIHEWDDYLCLVKQMWNII